MSGIVSRIAISGVFLLFCFYAQAQQVTLPYFNGWEDDAEISKWTLNSGLNAAKSPNKWYVSSKERFTGKRSLVISDLTQSTDTNAVYSNSRINIVAARSLKLPAGIYDFSFAWKCIGDGNADGLYVAFIKGSNPKDIEATTLAVPLWATGSTSVPFKGVRFDGVQFWTSAHGTFTSDGKNTMWLAFLWVNDAANAEMTSVCIDDIQIARQSCGSIENITDTVSEGRVKLSWEHANPTASYEVMYDTDYEKGYSGNITGIRGRQCQTDILPNGLYTFYVRAICGSDTGIWHPHQDVIIYNNSCVDYTALKSDKVTCYCGTNLNDGTGNQNPYREKKMVDYGEFSAQSRHTVVKHRYFDSRTDGNLPTIPENEFVSVRLGNWETSGEAEAIAYELHLDSGANTILLMKYAIVLEIPDMHTLAQMPRFRLEILDGKTNQLINPDCGLVDFYADTTLVEEGWHSADGVIYKDWSDIGVDLSEYAVAGARTVKVRLTTYDCSQGAHFGYAYFTLSCENGHLQNTSCLGTEELKAPYGFNYKWYRADDPDSVMISDQMILDVDKTDVSTYNCDVISKENPDCYFTLTASLLPHLPKADFEPEWRPSNCNNKIVLRNRSRIEAGGEDTGEALKGYEWTLEDGTVLTERSPEIAVPDEGAKMKVRLRVFTDEIGCEDIIEKEFEVKSIAAVSDTLHESICQDGNPFIINGKIYKDPGVYEISKATSKVTGCDSIYYLDLKVVDAFRVTLDTTICYGDTLEVAGQKWYQSMDGITVKAKSENGCDSIITVNLTVNKVEFNYSLTHATGWTPYGSITITDAAPDAYFSIDGVVGARLDSIPVGDHELIVYVEIAEGVTCEALLNFTIEAECLSAELLTIADVCADEDSIVIPFITNTGIVASYSIEFDNKGHAAGFDDIVNGTLPAGVSEFSIPLPENVIPDAYSLKITLTDGLCEPLVFNTQANVLYPYSVMQQKWYDVIAVKNAAYNGGYDFTAFSWYCNGALLPGQNKPYLYLGEDVRFTVGDEYSVELTRASDGAVVLSCPIVAEERNDVSEYPVSLELNRVKAGDKVVVQSVTSDCTVTVYDIGGRYYSTEHVNVDVPLFSAPSESGLYIVRIATADRTYSFKIIVMP